jgi:hypothetical protein
MGIGMISKDSVIIRQYKNSQKIDRNKLLKQAIKKNEKELVDINRDQMRKGDSGEGKIKPDYSPWYLNFKQGLPSYFAGDSPDLFLTGSFQDTMFLDVKGDQAEFDSRDGKTTKLVDKYGETLFDLNPNSMELAQDIVTPEFNRLYHLALNK